MSVVPRVLIATVAMGLVTAAPVSAEPIPSGARYVALGSSFAAGPGLPDTIDGGCARSARNYPHQVAAAAGLDLVDVTCSGATTANILDTPQSAGDSRPPQLEAVTADARLVTVTIGGNDLNLVGSIIAASGCAAVLGPAGQLCESLTGAKQPTAADYDRVERALIAVVDAVHVRAPSAEVLLVQYLPPVAQDAAVCPAAPMDRDQAARARVVYDNLIALTARAAEQAGAQAISVSDADLHGPCAREPWVSGLLPDIDAGPVQRLSGSYHPNLAGTTRVAERILAGIG
ncbi:SGNH/GDSL hydrolase family protein [Nocardia yamanashiensis]|uniref:SGNH/GDSL hydrolase family protein n=1 Tax=Nocardia yamanashiensis TaxID=209247 RepID=UPI00083566AB|nr:SGNH/GDSL hydrolase family protein [Nocardia yamanashiensis]